MLRNILLFNLKVWCLYYVTLLIGGATPTQDEGERQYHADNVYMPDLMDGFLLNQGGSVLDYFVKF